MRLNLSINFKGKSSIRSSGIRSLKSSGKQQNNLKKTLQGIEIHSIQSEPEDETASWNDEKFLEQILKPDTAGLYSGRGGFREKIEKIELFLIEKEFLRAKNLFYELKTQIEEKKEDKKLNYKEYIGFKKLEKMILNELGREEKLTVWRKEYKIFLLFKLFLLFFGDKFFIYKTKKLINPKKALSVRFYYIKEAKKFFF